MGQAVEEDYRGMENDSDRWTEFGNSVDVVEQNAPQGSLFGHRREDYAVVVEFEPVLVNDIVAKQVEMSAVETGRFAAEAPIERLDEFGLIIH